jgi:O-succinylbenzoic acid--CoA ligase
VSSPEAGAPPAESPLAAAARLRPDAPALVGEGLTLSYGELERRSAGAARALLASGLAPGDRVALRLPADARLVVLLHALLRAGLVAVPLSARIPAATIPGLLGGIGCRRLLLPPDADAVLREGRTAAAGATPAFDPAADATVIFTSGSTGRPKAALHSYANHWFSAEGSNRNIPVGPGDRWLLSLPLWHVGGLGILFRAALGGAAVALPGRLPIDAALAALGATHLSLVPTQLHRLLRDPAAAAPLGRVRAVLLGGSAIPPALVEEALRRGVPLFTSYGCTEMASQVTTTAPGDGPQRLLTAGRALAHREVRISGEGEILVRGATLFRGYLAHGAIDPARDADGWYRTGDLGRLDDAGYLAVDGRRDAMFISGGENIHPEEVERELCRFPGILEAVVVPVEDAEFGARPAAFLRSADGALPPPEALGAFLRERLPGFKVPVRYAPLPDGEGGLKPQRRELRARAARAGRG